MLFLYPQLKLWAMFNLSLSDSFCNKLHNAQIVRRSFELSKISHFAKKKTFPDVLADNQRNSAKKVTIYVLDRNGKIKTN